MSLIRMFDQEELSLSSAASAQHCSLSQITSASQPDRAMRSSFLRLDPTSLIAPNLITINREEEGGKQVGSSLTLFELHPGASLGTEKG